MATCNRLCAFCSDEVDADIAGELLVGKEVSVHQYCLYFASGLIQSEYDTEQDDVISGFHLMDIRKELRRGLRVKCTGCHRPGGYIGCAVKSCRSAGHFPCLHKLGYTFCYAGNFEAYCPRHSPTQPKLTLSGSKRECCICLTDLKSSQQLYCPCCLTAFHKTCVQKQALSSGFYHFRCPVCTDKDVFCKEMLRMGIAIPDRDAQWEVGTTYSSEESKFCHGEPCLCPQGRSYHTQIGKYRIRKCRTCGQYMGHVECLRENGSSECRDCASASQALSREHNAAIFQRLKVPVILLRKLNSDDIALINSKARADH